MARTRARTYESQRERILAQAAMLFAQRGYTATSMNEVAEACGVSKPALYYYFKDKYDLLVWICAGHIQRLIVVVEEVERLGLSGEDRLRRLIRAFVEEYTGAQYEHRVLTEDVKFLKPEDQRRVLEGERYVVSAVAGAIAQIRPDLGAVRLTKPLTMLMFGMINWMFTWLRPDGSLTHEDMAPIVADLFLGGLGAVNAKPLTDQS
jgi:TetR/AcrR family transcriptional regulator